MSKWSIYSRIFSIAIGLSIASLLLIYSVRWEALPIQFTIGAANVTPYFMAVALVIASLFAMTLIKSGIKGEYELAT
jgi:hypothetical protein